MDENEVMLRAIGILTQGKARLAAIGSQDTASSGMSEAIAQLVVDLFPKVSVPADATPAEVLEKVEDVVSYGVGGLVTAFVHLHVELAELHDTGRTDTTSTDLLRALALRFSAPSDDNT